MWELKGYNDIAESVVSSSYKEAAIILPGPPIHIFAQRAAPTVTFKSLQQAKGMFYFECLTHTGGFMQVGWADAHFKAVIEEGKGVGDDTNSWAYDGTRSLKWHNNVSSSYGKQWKAGDIIGCALNLNHPTEISFSLNGEWLGTAFENFTFTGYMYPCVTLLRGEHVEFNLGTADNPFVFKPPMINYTYLSVTQPVQNKTLANRLSDSVTVVNLDMSMHSFDEPFPGEIYVTVMGKGLAYEATKNAIINAGYKETLKFWEHMYLQRPVLKNLPLTKDEKQAILCYTLENPPVYRFFNNDTQKGFKGEGNDFPILNFLLKEACRKLLKIQIKENKSRLVYRGSRGVYFECNVGDRIKFGRYTSTSVLDNVAANFQDGDGSTKFLIRTKLGVLISMLSLYAEEEVLVPPFEIFKVVKIEREENNSNIYLESIINDTDIIKYVEEGRIAWNNI